MKILRRTGLAVITVATAIALMGAAPAPAATPISSGCAVSVPAAVGEYQKANGLSAADSTYVSCAGSIVALTGTKADGSPVTPSVTDKSSQTSSGKTPAAAQRQTGVGGGGASCDINVVYSTECYFSFSYQKYRGSTLIWTRHIDGYSRLNLQQISQQVYMRLTHKEGISFNASGSMVLQRMQGITSPTYENGSNFNFTNGGTQVSGTVYVSRTTRDTGKYSIVFGVRYIFDKAEGANVPVVTDPTSPRFQCYSLAQNKNCEYPNAQEAGVF